MKTRFILLLVLSLVPGFLRAQTLIDRKSLVERHSIINKSADTLSSLSVGNGRFAFTVDVTGLQSFPESYQNGVPLGTQSEWGWHSFPNTNSYRFEETLQHYDLNGRSVSYSVQTTEPGRVKNAVDWFRQNPHRLQLGNIGFEFFKEDGSIAGIGDIHGIHQSLNMWTGEIQSKFLFEDVPVEVITYAHQQHDEIAVTINSKLLNQGRLKIRLRFPYPTGEWKDGGSNLSPDNRHNSTVSKNSANGASIRHNIDKVSWFADLRWSGKAVLAVKDSNYFLISPVPSFAGSSASKSKPGDDAGSSPAGSFEISCRFDRQANRVAAGFYATRSNSRNEWARFWKSGAAVDFSGSIDSRANELERRIVLSQYLTKIQCAGNYPPQETGLTYNSWYGRPHLEMHWWHGIHFSLWGRTSLLANTITWYNKAAAKGRAIAKRQGYNGVRWQKMTDNDGNESPSSVGAFLVWQQPHIIYFAELCYRADSSIKTIDKYKDLVFATADFMASYAYADTVESRYKLGPGLIPAQERFDPLTTFNPTYELVYWHWALKTASRWRARTGMPPVKKWEDVLTRLSHLPVQEGKYLFTENASDSYTNPAYRTDHPSVLGALGMLPHTTLLDTAVMASTFNWIWDNWNWDHTWGWDFPMTAMSATRLGMPERAVDALLMPVTTNTYLNNGHNYQDKRLTLYLPGNGGLLASIAMMCAGYDGCKTENPGIPKNGKWKVRWEGLMRMP